MSNSPASPRRARPGEIQDTPLTWAIRMIRFRLRMRQLAFALLVTGHQNNPVVSRWESGQRVPSLGNLLSLLKLANTAEERTPIVEALRANGIDDLIGNLPTYFLHRTGGDALLQNLRTEFETAVFNGKA